MRTLARFERLFRVGQSEGPPSSVASAHLSSAPRSRPRLTPLASRSRIALAPRALEPLGPRLAYGFGCPQASSHSFLIALLLLLELPAIWNLRPTARSAAPFRRGDASLSLIRRFRASEATTTSWRPPRPRASCFLPRALASRSGVAPDEEMAMVNGESFAPTTADSPGDY